MSNPSLKAVSASFLTIGYLKRVTLPLDLYVFRAAYAVLLSHQLALLAMVPELSRRGRDPDVAPNHLNSSSLLLGPSFEVTAVILRKQLHLVFTVSRTGGHFEKAALRNEERWGFLQKM